MLSKTEDLIFLGIWTKLNWTYYSPFHNKCHLPVLFPIHFNFWLILKWFTEKHISLLQVMQQMKCYKINLYFNVTKVSVPSKKIPSTKRVSFILIKLFNQLLVCEKINHISCDEFNYKQSLYWVSFINLNFLWQSANIKYLK